MRTLLNGDSEEGAQTFVGELGMLIFFLCVYFFILVPYYNNIILTQFSYQMEVIIIII